MADPRMNPIRCHYEGCAAGLSFHQHAHDPAVFPKRSVHVDTTVCCNAVRCLRRMEENVV